MAGGRAYAGMTRSAGSVSPVPGTARWGFGHELAPPHGKAPDGLSDPAGGPPLLDGRRHFGVDDDARREASGESGFPGGPEVGEEGVEFLAGFPHVEGKLVERPQGLRTDGAGDGVEVGILSRLNLERRQAVVAPGVGR